MIWTGRLEEKGLCKTTQQLHGHVRVWIQVSGLTGPPLSFWSSSCDGPMPYSWASAYFLAHWTCSFAGVSQSYHEVYHISSLCMRVGINEVWFPMGLFAMAAWLWSLRKKRSNSGFLIVGSPSVPFLTPLQSVALWRAFVVSCTQTLIFRKPIGTPLPSCPLPLQQTQLKQGAGFNRRVQDCSRIAKAMFSSGTEQLGLMQDCFCLSAFQPSSNKQAEQILPTHL